MRLEELQAITIRKKQMLGNTKGRLINKYVPDYVLFDLETTGTSSNYDEVIEISAVKVQSGVIVGEFSQLVNPREINSVCSEYGESYHG